MSDQLIQTPCTFGENGNFLLERKLGEGGMGGVYMGRDKMLDRPVAVKVMLKELGSDPEFVEKFKKEAQSAARLIHPNIAQIYSYGICDGMPYIAMELASGGSLFSVMNANPGKTDVARILKICQQVAQALQCASDQGCVHGDVKPENILFDANGNAKLVDFGLAAMQKDTNEIWGTPYYIAPEKVKKEAVDFRADMYSLGGTLYHALTGVAPFEGVDSIAVVKKRFTDRPKKPSEVRPDLTPAVDALVMKMLALEKENRYPSFEALLEAFKNVLTSGLSANSAAKSAAGAAKSSGGTKRLTTRGRRTVSMTRPATTTARRPVTASTSIEDDEEQEGGSLGLKVFGAIFGGLLLIGAVIGGLVWFKVADQKSRTAEEQAQITTGIEKARAAIADTLTSASKLANEFDTFAAQALAECQKPTDELKKILPEEQGTQLKPGFSKELLDAIASTNAAPQTAEKPATPAATNAAPVAVADDAVAPKADLTPQIVITMNELWYRAYACQAAAIRIHASIGKILEKGAEADGIRDVTRENMEKIADLSRTLVEMFDTVKASKDAEIIRKGVSYIKSRGEKAVDQTVKRLRIEKLEAERKAKAEAAAKEEEERKKRLAEERKALVEKETAAARTRFDAIVAQGSIRQLDWRNALRQLESEKEGMKTAEGQLAFDLEIRKVNDMKNVQDRFIKNLKGYTFRAKGKLNKHKVTFVTAKEIGLLKPDGKTRLKLLWQSFYKDCPGNFNEIINVFIVPAANPTAKDKLSKREWADVMIGAALTMQLVCSEVNGATEKAQILVKKVVEEFPEYQKTAQSVFPTMTFGDEDSATGSGASKGAEAEDEDFGE